MLASADYWLEKGCPADKLTMDSDPTDSVKQNLDTTKTTGLGTAAPGGLYRRGFIHLLVWTNLNSCFHQWLTRKKESKFKLDLTLP